jgi:hypothetical protein
MNPSGLEFIVASLIKAGFTIPTLGGESEIQFLSEEGRLWCITRSGSKISITLDLIRLTCQRYEELKRKWETNSQGTPLYRATGQYNDPNWTECPDRITCPYIAAVLVYVEEAMS